MVKATVNGKTYAMKETGGIWRTRVHDLPMGDHRASLEAEWLGGEKKRVAMLDVSITDGKFIGFDPAMEFTHLRRKTHASNGGFGDRQADLPATRYTQRVTGVR
ncbi:MAG: hypothetical protein MZW92_61825 [Comamonadaceae bacterium]|nr:hypothetical protein [Comamonadaceae bacterium]MCK7499700.1 hypothetical protein [Comamonadaceae bacterium]